MEVLRDYGVIVEKVKKAIEDYVTFDLAIAYTQRQKGQEIIPIIADQILTIVEDAGTFDLTVTEFLYLSLEESDYMKASGEYESEQDAERDGFYWIDEIEKWLKLDTNK